MTQEVKEFCFCTLALGQSYRSLASLLAKDLEQHSPGTFLVVLTDKPQDFRTQANVLAFFHRQQSVYPYHDKRFVIAKALSLSNSCIFVDADMRILSSVPQSLEFLQGLKGRVCIGMSKHYERAMNGTGSPKLCREFKVVDKAIQKLGLDLKDKNLRFVFEYLFSVTRDSGRELEFLKQWEALAHYFELNGIHDGEGSVIGLAAAKAGLVVMPDPMEGISFFKDRVESVRIKNGQSDPQAMSLYFETQKKLEKPSRSIPEKLAIRLSKSLGRFYRSMRLRVAALGNPGFYYR